MEVPAGGMMVNHLAFRCRRHLVSVGASGMGAYRGRWGFEEFSHHKSVTKPTGRPVNFTRRTERAIKGGSPAVLT